MIWCRSFNFCALQALLALPWFLVIMCAKQIMLFHGENLKVVDELGLSWKATNPQFKYVGSSSGRRIKIEAENWKVPHSSQDRWQTLVVASKNEHSSMLHELGIEEDHIRFDHNGLSVNLRITLTNAVDRPPSVDTSPEPYYTGTRASSSNVN
ncbi:uncharacterized protein MELLADRAFT_124584 [Melampsora larici-populina 98AG31]|uniref:Secreted protein n=1 Tax=Melampsora larici-populina (strain 98AG31 / pathotype 3-4-7) TaxID=747676 RepID=F4SDZ2_MELLP|nr:uncharacterized protein MELLADRAFT_124584 [Melampsora larici-populina 98AG31]EGF97134.1 secreted protein [Melampsora larici-populina 98AG31]